MVVVETFYGNYKVVKKFLIAFYSSKVLYFTNQTVKLLNNQSYVNNIQCSSD